MLLSNGVLSRLCDSVGKRKCFDAIRESRDNVLGRGGDQDPTEDLKPAAQAVHHAAKTELQLKPSGESKNAFMRDVLAPLVTEGTPEYQLLKRDIFEM